MCMICALHSAGEALCPFCAKFSLLLKQLQDSSVLDLADLNYVAWGNAQWQNAGVGLDDACARLHRGTNPLHGVAIQAGPRCQHGPVECSMNRVQNCAIHLNPDQAVWLPFVACLEKIQVSFGCTQALSNLLPYSLPLPAG